MLVPIRSLELYSLFAWGGESHASKHWEHLVCLSELQMAGDVQTREFLEYQVPPVVAATPPQTPYIIYPMRGRRKAVI